MNALLAAETTTSGARAGQGAPARPCAARRGARAPRAPRRERSARTSLRPGRGGLRARPGRLAAEVVDGVEGEVVLDCGAGTGKLTRLLGERFPRVIAVEPLGGMRAVLERSSGRPSRCDGPAEAIPLAEGRRRRIRRGGVPLVRPASGGPRARASPSAGRHAAALFNDWKGRSRAVDRREGRGASSSELEARRGAGGGASAAGEWKRGFDGHRSRRSKSGTSITRTWPIASAPLRTSCPPAPRPLCPNMSARRSPRAFERRSPRVTYRVEIDTHVYEARRL